MIRVTVDRIEGPMAVLEVGDVHVDWPLAALPAGIAEGDHLSVVFEVEAPDEAEASRTADAAARLARLEARGPKGDTIDL